MAADGAQGRVLHREVIGLTVLVVICVLGLVLTRAAAASNRKMRLDDAARWYARAAERVAAGRPGDGVPLLRRAVAIDRDNVRYRLALASALAAGRQDEPARQVLVGLRQLTPEDPEVNVQLARLESRHQDMTAAIQYYQNALYGLWPADRETERRHLRVELIEYLLRNKQQSRALSELLVLSANLPDVGEAQRQIGRLFLEAGDPPRALDHFARALRLDPRDSDARRGAGEAAFAAGDYARARSYLRAAGALPARVARLSEVADTVLTSDPLAPRLKLDERRRRLAAGLEQVIRRLRECPGGSELMGHEVTAFLPTVTPRAVREDPDRIDQGVELIGRAEQAAADRCGPGSPADEAWRAIAARHSGNDRR